MKAYLALEDGTVFFGKAIGASGEAIGELVFDTSITGYENVVTDPNYFSQIVVMTYPLIGNYGVNRDIISDKPHLKGLVAKEVCKTPSNWRSLETLGDYLKRNNTVGIEGVIQGF